VLQHSVKTPLRNVKTQCVFTLETVLFFFLFHTVDRHFVEQKPAKLGIFCLTRRYNIVEINTNLLYFSYQLSYRVIDSKKCPLGSE
jgi:hypothetical protein